MCGAFDRLRTIGAEALIRGMPDMVQRLGSLKTQAAHFAPFIDLVTRAVHVVIATGTPLRWPHPARRRTRQNLGAKRIAVALDTVAHVLAIKMMDSFCILGLNCAWKGARMAKIAALLVATDHREPYRSPRRLEKTPGLDRLNRPFDVWHSLFEPERGRVYRRLSRSLATVRLDHMDRLCK